MNTIVQLNHIEQSIMLETLDLLFGRHGVTFLIEKPAQNTTNHWGLKQLNKQSGTAAEDDSTNIMVSHLAPSVQSDWDIERARNAFISRQTIDTVGSSKSPPVSDDITWKHAINKSKHVWSSGPFGKKESLLELDDFEDWLGRCRPSVLGKEGVAVAADTGEHALADILARNGDEADSASVNSAETSVDSRQKNWV